MSMFRVRKRDKHGNVDFHRLGEAVNYPSLTITQRSGFIDMQVWLYWSSLSWQDCFLSVCAYYLLSSFSILKGGCGGGYSQELLSSNHSLRFIKNNKMTSETEGLLNLLFISKTQHTHYIKNPCCTITVASINQQYKCLTLHNTYKYLQRTTCFRQVHQTI